MTMSDHNHSLESLQELHADLLALSESRLSNIDRLGLELEAHVNAFRALLHKSPRNDQSRNIVAPSNRQTENKQQNTDQRLELRGNSYKVNEEFIQGALEVAGSLNLDELEAAELFLDAQSDSDATGRPARTCAIIRFHRRRKELLDCLCLTLKLTYDDINQDLKSWLHGLIDQIVEPQDTNNESRFIPRCLSSMDEIRVWLQELSTLAIVTNQQTKTDGALAKLESIEYERASLVKQHESLGVIVFYLAKNSSIMSDFESVLETMRKMERYDEVLLHCFPVLFAQISCLGTQEGDRTIENAREMNDKLLAPTTGKPWALAYIHAAIRAWWLAEYSSWYGENYDGSLAPNQLAEENNQRSRQFADALKDGAFDCLISLAADVKSQDWYDPARHGLRTWLQRKAPSLQGAVDATFSSTFQEILMGQLETFVEGFVTNLHDVLRKLRIEEDEQRQNSTTHDHDLDLERFLVIISYVFENRPKAAFESFWDVPDGALMGFIHWVSRRASTPLVSAFCEMLQAISEDEESATAAHEFLLDEGPQSSGKTRRHSLTWNQIIKELTFFCANLRDRPAVPQTFGPGASNNEHAELEPESFLMLECYLRVITRLCATSPTARSFLLSHPTFQLTEMLFQFVSSSISPRLKACAFTTLRSILANKTKEAGDYIWVALDVWISGGYSPGSNTAKSSMPVPVSVASTERILRGLSNGFEEPNAFIQLLCALIAPYESEDGLYDGLPFPENLGSSSRMPGIEPYIDFALGQVFGSQTTEINDIKQLRLLQLSCLEFIAISLDTFNEDLLIFGNRTRIVVDNAIAASDLKTYVLLHPFTRVMEWMFNERVMNALFAAVHHDPVDVGNASQDSPLIKCVLRGIHVITMILDLQATYLDIVRPLVRTQSSRQRLPVSNAAFSSFEDGILSHLTVIVDLGLYCGAGQPELVIASLKLLQKLSASTKLASATVTGMGRLANRNKAIAALEVNNDSDVIAKSLLHEMKAPIDINQGAGHASFLIQVHILDFLDGCLKASPGQPTIAHLLLGFKCRNNIIDVDPDSPFSQGISLFHCILEIAMLAPVGVDDDTSVTSYLVTLKYKALRVLRQLWQSPLSSALVIDAMRSVQSIFLMFGKQIMITSDTLFDGRLLEDTQLFESSAGSTLSQFVGQRAIMLQYASAELRIVAQSHLPSLKTKIITTLLGSIEEDGLPIETISIFHIFDFIELDFAPIPDPLFPTWISDVDFSICLENQDESIAIYNLAKVQELLVLRRAEMLNGKLLEDTLAAAGVSSDMS